MPKPIPTELREALRAAKAQGVPAKIVRARYGISRSTFLRHTDDITGPLSRRFVKGSEVQEWKRLLDEGWSYTDIARRYGRSHSSIRRHAHDARRDRVYADQQAIMELYAQTHNAREVARRLGFSHSAVHRRIAKALQTEGNTAVYARPLPRPARKDLRNGKDNQVRQVG